MDKRKLLLAGGLALLIAAASCPRKGVPATPTRPKGDTISYQHVAVSYRTVCDKPSQDGIRMVFDWGDDRIDTTALISGWSPISMQHTWLDTGTHEVRARAISGKGLQSGWSPLLAVLVRKNSPPDKPNVPMLPPVIMPHAGDTIPISATVSDPDLDSVFVRFYFDVTDTSINSGWLGPVPSDSHARTTHVYEMGGDYWALCLAKDTKGAVSVFSDTFGIPVDPLRIAWEFQTPSGEQFNSSPAIAWYGPGAFVVVGCEDGSIYSFEAETGELRGSFSSFTGAAWSSSPGAFSQNGLHLYAADNAGWLYVLDADNLGAPVDHYPPTDTPISGMTPFFSSPAVYFNRIYVGRDDGLLYQFRDNGPGYFELTGTFDAGSAISSSPAISPAGNRIVFGTDAGKVFCVSSTLDTIWVRQLGGAVHSSPALGSPTVAYVGCDDRCLYSLSMHDGQDVNPPFVADDRIVASPIVGFSGDVFIVSAAGTVYGLHDGVELWRRDLPYHEMVSATPCLGPDSTLIINTDGDALFDRGSVYSIGTTGQNAGHIKWRFPLPTPTPGHRPNTTSLVSSPTIGTRDGRIYLGSASGGFFALEVTKPTWLNGQLPDTPWPKFHHDITNSGRAD